jgi:hypothetical protein
MLVNVDDVLEVPEVNVIDVAVVGIAISAESRVDTVTNAVDATFGLEV